MASTCNLPPSAAYQWRCEIVKWLQDFVSLDEVQVITCRQDEVRQGCKFVIVPYSLIHEQHFQRTAAGKAFEVVICDESHYIKEPTSKRTRAALPLLPQARRVVLLSGTLPRNKPSELYTQTI